MRELKLSVMVQPGDNTTAKPEALSITEICKVIEGILQDYTLEQLPQRVSLKVEATAKPGTSKVREFLVRATEQHEVSPRNYWVEIESAN